MLQVRQIINDIYSSNTYLLIDDMYDYCWLVDIGDYYKVKAAIKPESSIRGLFLTHTHFDHIYGINDLFNEQPQCKVYCSEYGREALYDVKKNFSKYHDSPTVYKGKDVRVLTDGAVIELYPGATLTAYSTPGHCPSCLTYVMDKWIFTGDSYLPGLKVVTNLPKCDKNKAEESLQKIKILSEFRFVCPGHGEMEFEGLKINNPCESINQEWISL